MEKVFNWLASNLLSIEESSVPTCSFGTQFYKNKINMSKLLFIFLYPVINKWKNESFVGASPRACPLCRDEILRY